MNQVTTAPPPDQDRPRGFLIGHMKPASENFSCCPFSTTLLAWSNACQEMVIVALQCRRWGCCYCGPRKMKLLAYRTNDAKPTKFITLTIDTKLWESPRAAFDGTRRKVSDFAKLVRSAVGEFEYLRVLESTARGWPHYHFVARCDFIPQHRLSTMWAELTGAPIVDIRHVHKKTNVIGYVMKYLGKQTSVPWTTRRVSWSRNFFPKDDRIQKGSLKLIDKERFEDHPLTWMDENARGELAEQIGDGIWLMKKADSPPTRGLPLS